MGTITGKTCYVSTGRRFHIHTSEVTTRHLVLDVLESEGMFVFAGHPAKPLASRALPGTVVPAWSHQFYGF